MSYRIVATQTRFCGCGQKVTHALVAGLEGEGTGEIFIAKTGSRQRRIQKGSQLQSCPNCRRKLSFRSTSTEKPKRVIAS